MGLFDQIINAIDNPNQQANPNQIDNIYGTVQQLGNNYGATPDATQMALSMVGNYVRSALQQQRNTAGPGQAQQIVNQYSGTTPNNQAVQALFPPQMQGHIIQEVAQRTGLNAQTIQMMLPVLIPIVLNFLKTGSNVQNPQQGQNPVLNNFLDADRDGDVDIADAIQLAGRHFTQGNRF
ncbi:DUF937 domain-containing protein [Microcoleus sp. FACHB-68]|uniref:DUF937 domain-containing protein n=1 Tax=Microcoleus sp. FACHB-68 TaxID=2692826 RepID=UPI001682666B|nr:DUF937 domain-containing protein [Microcoleus sp. FACHB-68]MBD1938134.1 hypothetical protein [Microcoleus sp. FACHB-68]